MNEDFIFHMKLSNHASFQSFQRLEGTYKFFIRCNHCDKNPPNYSGFCKNDSMCEEYLGEYENEMSASFYIREKKNILDKLKNTNNIRITETDIYCKKCNKTYEL